MQKREKERVPEISQGREAPSPVRIWNILESEEEAILARGSPGWVKNFSQQ
jgi:hypothetical protein